MSNLRGKRASKSGLYGEETFSALLDMAGFTTVSWKKHDGSTPAAVYQYPVPHPYRPSEPRAGKNDYMLFTGKAKIYCQVKNQTSSGTCDEKLAFSFDIARYALTEQPFDVYALLLFGPWWAENPGIVEWAQRKCVEFEMLAGGTRAKTTARVLVGPQEIGKWLRSLQVVQHNCGLFND